MTISAFALIDLPVEQSVIFSLAIPFAITRLSYFSRDYIDLSRPQKVRLHKGMNATEFDACAKKSDKDLGYTIIRMFYVEGMSLTAIAQRLNYSYDYISENKRKKEKELR